MSDHDQFRMNMMAMIAGRLQAYAEMPRDGAGPAVPPPLPAPMPAMPPMPRYQPSASLVVNPNMRDIGMPRTPDETQLYIKALAHKQVSKANMSARQEHAMEVLVKYRQDKQKASSQLAGPASKKARRVQEDEDEEVIEDEDEEVIEDEEVAEELAIEPPAAEDEEDDVRVLPDPPADAGAVPMPTEKQKKGFNYALTRLQVTGDFAKDSDFIKLVEQKELGNYTPRTKGLVKKTTDKIQANELVRPGYIAWALTIGEGIGETNWAAPESPEDEARFEAFRKKLIRGKSFDTVVPDDLKWRRLNK
jgi:hypothetical protein